VSVGVGLGVGVGVAVRVELGVGVGVAVGVGLDVGVGTDGVPQEVTTIAKTTITVWPRSALFTGSPPCKYAVPSIPGFV